MQGTKSLPDISNCRQPKTEHIYLPLGLQKYVPTHPTGETERFRSMQMRKLPYEKRVCNLSWAGHLQQWKGTRIELWHYDLFTTVLQILKAA